MHVCETAARTTHADKGSAWPILLRSEAVSGRCGILRCTCAIYTLRAKMNPNLNAGEVFDREIGRVEIRGIEYSLRHHAQT
jgi:hypothetical protein